MIDHSTQASLINNYNNVDLESTKDNRLSQECIECSESHIITTKNQSLEEISTATYIVVLSMLIIAMGMLIGLFLLVFQNRSALSNKLNIGIYSICGILATGLLASIIFTIKLIVLRVKNREYLKLPEDTEDIEDTESLCFEYQVDEEGVSDEDNASRNKQAKLIMKHLSNPENSEDFKLKLLAEILPERQTKIDDVPSDPITHLNLSIALLKQLTTLLQTTLATRALKLSDTKILGDCVESLLHNLDCASKNVEMSDHINNLLLNSSELSVIKLLSLLLQLKELYGYLEMPSLIVEQGGTHKESLAKFVNMLVKISNTYTDASSSLRSAFNKTLSLLQNDFLESSLIIQRYYLRNTKLLGITESSANIAYYLNLVIYGKKEANNITPESTNTTIFEELYNTNSSANLESTSRELGSLLKELILLLNPIARIASSRRSSYPR